MAAHGHPEVKEVKECANCGECEGLAKCSRCRTEWFCGVKCQKAYWPFHKEFCKRNDFADAIEQAGPTEPKFARFLRKHGKQAVIKDDEVDRLERKIATAEDMYGKADPRPTAPSYTAEERLRMAAAEELEQLKLRGNTRDGEWAAIELPAELSADCGDYKWRQDQSRVEVFVKLRDGQRARHVAVHLTPTHIKVTVAGRAMLDGPLYRAIKAEESHWLVKDGVLELSLLKLSRRGHYADGDDNAKTFWRAVTTRAAPSEILPAVRPPGVYYNAPWEKDPLPATRQIAGYGASRPMIDRSREA